MGTFATSQGHSNARTPPTLSFDGVKHGLIVRHLHHQHQHQHQHPNLDQVLLDHLHHLDPPQEEWEVWDARTIRSVLSSYSKPERAPGAIYQWEIDRKKEER